VEGKHAMTDEKLLLKKERSSQVLSFLYSLT